MRKIISITISVLMVATTLFVPNMTPVEVQATADDPYNVEKLEGAVDTEKNNYMTDDQYKKLFGVNIDSKDVDAFDPDNTYNPLDGYQPTILNELFLGYMNRTNNYDGQFAVMENASNNDGFNIDKMWNTNYGGVNTYYGEDQNEDMHTHAINTIALTPGDLTEEGARTRQQILIESRIWLKEDGFMREDDTHHMISTYTLNDSEWTRKECSDVYLADEHWACNIDVAEEQSYTAMSVGDYDGDNFNEVAIYVPSNTDKGEMACVDIYQPKAEGNVYSLQKEYSFRIDEMGSRFDVWMGKYHSYVHLETTRMAGRDDLVVSVTQPFLTEDEFAENGALAVWSFQGGKKSLIYNDDLEYSGYRFKMSATVKADLNGDCIDELVVGGFKNTDYNANKGVRGLISNSEYLVNVLLYENDTYKLAWDKPQTTSGIELDHSREADAPAAIAAGKYRSGSVIDTVFLEGTYLDFKTGSGADANAQIRNGKFLQDTSENINRDMSDATINIGASGAFVSDKAAMEEVVLFVIEATNSSHSKVDVDIVWGHAGEEKLITETVNDNYIDNTEENDGTIITMCPINVDDDSGMMKYAGKSVGWSNPVVYGILMSMPYWQELDYGELWNARGQTDFGVTRTKEDGTEVTVGVDMEKSLSICAEEEMLGNGLALGVDFGLLSSYGYSKTDTTSLAKSMTWSSGGGVDSAAVMVVPVITYKYDFIIPEHAATLEELAAGKDTDNDGIIEAYKTTILCTDTAEPVYTQTDVDTYNDVVEDFNAMADAAGHSEDKLAPIDMQEVYKGAKTGDPSTYASKASDISSVDGDDYVYIGEVYAQTGKDKAVETLNIETSTSTTESNGFSLGLKAGYMGEVMFGFNVMSILSVTGKLGLGVTGQIAAGGTWATTTTTGITYSGAFANLPQAAAEHGYEYSAGLAKWNASLEGHDDDITFEDSDEKLTDKTVVIAPVVITDTQVPPALPTDLHVLTTTEDKAVLEWTNPENSRAADYYKLYYSKAPDGEYYPIDGTIDASKTRFVVNGLTSDSTYYFKIESYKSQSSAASVLSAPVSATTKTGAGPVIIEHPVNCYAKAGEKAEFVIEAKSSTAGNKISYQWQKLSVGDYGISWEDVNVPSDSTIGHEAVFNAAYASPDGLVREQDIDDLNETVYRCLVAEHQSDKLEYTETISNSATLYVGEGNFPEETSLQLSATGGEELSEGEVHLGIAEKITAEAVLTDSNGNVLADKPVHFALMKDGKSVSYKEAVTDEKGKSYVDFGVQQAGEYEIQAVMFKQGNQYRATVSNALKIIISESYEINYVLNGGINHNLNPLRYAIGSQFILLRDAAREGYEFTGWYFDSDLTDKVQNKWLNIREMTGPLTLYAGWKAIEEPGDPGNPDDSEETPDDTAKPEDPDDRNDTTGTGEDNGKTKTGDDCDFVVPVVLMIAAAVGGAVTIFIRRKRAL